MSKIKEIRISDIKDPANPMRSDIDNDGIAELAKSIKNEGLINPITVRWNKDFYEVVAGHRRFLACRMVGLSTIPCVIRTLSDEQTQELMAHENLFREDVDPVDEAIQIGRLINNLHWTVDKVSEKLNHTKQWVEDRLGILDYPDYMIEFVKQGKLKLGVAKHLVIIEDDVYRKMYVDQAIKYGMSVIQAEYLRRQYEMGILTPSDQIAEEIDNAPAKEPAKAKAMCAKCGGMAEDPNLQNVFIHIECPSE